MSMAKLDSRELTFLEQKEIFVTEALASLGLQSLHDVPDYTERVPIVLPPVLIEDYRHLTQAEIEAVVASYWGEFGVAYFIVQNPTDKGTHSHPLLEIASQLQNVIPLKYPMTNPMEGRQEERLGPPDGTLKIYNLKTNSMNPLQRNIAETAEQFDAHNDGFGYGGAVEVFALYADSPSLWGGFTYFQNVVALSLQLAKTDPDAFASLFLPNAITALRSHGTQAIKVTTPVLFVNESGKPQVFFRVAVNEYDITWRPSMPALERAAAFLNKHARPFAAGSGFVHLNRSGAGVMARNHWIVHGRTPFIDGKGPRERRVLARKWFASSAENAGHRHVPGMRILERYASLYPEHFADEFLVGAWRFDVETGKNVRRM
jgi:hypothetical protein